ncbi:haloacid dehalogenase type II [Sphingopyxis sp.]|uniref:haloacid dehalogenase type II n=1 Tax=Sphingopyxis sp. TaxID=1908224 RepID=UPI002FC6AD0A
MDTEEQNLRVAHALQVESKARLVTCATPPKVLAFDVFGTVVDWRTSVIRESAAFLAQIGRADADAAEFSDSWRFRYIDVMRAFRESGRGFVALDVLHREMLEQTLHTFAIDPAAIDDDLLSEWVRAWRRLDPWPDAVAGLTRLKTRFPVVTLSNGNIALMVAMARRAGLPWDAILGAEVTRTYKPDPQAYLGTAAILGVAPEEICLVAAHHSDLAAARACGFLTAHIDRPQEYGGRRAPDADAAQNWNWMTDSLTGLADLLGC